MKVKILTEFRDKNDFLKVYEKDSIVDIEESRAKELIKLKLAEDTEKDSVSRNIASKAKTE